MENAASHSDVVSQRSDRVDPKKIALLEAFIAGIRQSAVETRQLLIWLIRQSESLSRPVGVSLHARDVGEEMVRRMYADLHDMVSVGCSIHLDSFMQHEVGTPLRFVFRGRALCWGALEFTSESPNGQGCTVWITSSRGYSNTEQLEMPSPDSPEHFSRIELPKGYSAASA